jgi:hypothetical protein
VTRARWSRPPRGRRARTACESSHADQIRSIQAVNEFHLDAAVLESLDRLLAADSRADPITLFMRGVQRANPLRTRHRQHGQALGLIPEGIWPTDHPLPAGYGCAGPSRYACRDGGAVVPTVRSDGGSQLREEKTPASPRRAGRPSVVANARAQPAPLGRCERSAMRSAWPLAVDVLVRLAEISHQDIGDSASLEPSWHGQRVASRWQRSVGLFGGGLDALIQMIRARLEAWTELSRLAGRLARRRHHA